jgi:WD40 repeat protein
VYSKADRDDHSYQANHPPRPSAECLIPLPPSWCPLRLATAGGDKQVFLWDVSTAQKIRRFKGHDSAINAIQFAADDAVIVTAGYDRAVKIWVWTDG